MSKPDLDEVKNYVYGRLAGELPGRLFYHNLFHTRDMVMPAIRLFSRHERVTSADLVLLETGALFHDLGFVIRYHENESLAADIASENLPRWGFSDEQIEIVRGVILATRMPQNPGTRLEAVMCDADLSHLGLPDFLFFNECLRRERAAVGEEMSREDWYRDSIGFLKSHRYFTASARAFRDSEKELNIGRLRDHLAACKKGSRPK